MSQKNKLIINCGTTQVSAGLFSVSGGRLVLESFDVRDLDYDYGHPDAWLAALNAALRSMKLSGRADVIVPTASILTKTITVPHVDGITPRDAVAFEAEKNIPYPLSEVTWDFQVISDDGVETEILLASMKADAADDFCAAVTYGSVSPATLQASSILDYNAWRYCGLEENVMILNLGAKASNLIIARNDGLFVRSVPIGGNAITQSISDNLGKSFMQAEAIKRGYFLDAAKLESGDAAAELIKNSIRSIAKRLAIELKRSILNYKRKGTVESPKALYLTGRASLTPGLAEYLCEELQVEVKYFDTLSSLSVSPKVDQELLRSSYIHLSELVGDAARMVLKDSVGVNLLPGHVVEAFAFERKRPFMLLGAALLVAAAVPPFFVLKDSIALNNRLAADYAQKTPALEQRFAEFNESKEVAAGLVSKIADLGALAESKSNWIKLFADFEKRIVDSKDVWLEDMKVLRSMRGGKLDYRLQLSGRLLLRDVKPGEPYDYEKALGRIDTLLTSFKDSEFIKEYVDVRTDTTNPRILKFTFTLVVNPDKPI